MQLDTKHYQMLTGLWRLEQQHQSALRRLVCDSCAAFAWHAISSTELTSADLHSIIWLRFLPDACFATSTSIPIAENANQTGASAMVCVGGDAALQYVRLPGCRSCAKHKHCCLYNWLAVWLFVFSKAKAEAGETRATCQVKVSHNTRVITMTPETAER